jgi:hypothetical protein
LHFKFDGVAFVQGLVPITDDRLEMNEHVFSSRTGNEAVSFGCVEPLYCPSFHE